MIWNIYQHLPLPKITQFCRYKYTSTMVRIWEKVFIRFAIDPTVPAWWFGTMEFYDFPFSWECHHPNWRTPWFFRGVAQPPTSFSSVGVYQALAYWPQQDHRRNRWSGGAEKRCCWSMLIFDFLRLAWISNWKKHPGYFEGFYVQQTGDVHQLCKVGCFWNWNPRSHFWVNVNKSEIFMNRN